MSDVAALAQVSQQTVSRVLNDHPNVARATRARVEQAVRELGYHRNLAARMLATGRSNMVGVIAHNTTLHGPSSTVEALSMAAMEAGMAVSVGHLPAFEPAALRRVVDQLVGQGVLGIVLLLPVEVAAGAIDELPEDIPVVTVDGPPGWRGANVSVDQHLGGRLATEHLVSLGHRHIWHVSGPPEWNDSAAREQGWLDVLERHHLAAPPVLRADWSPESGYRAGQLLARIPECTAVFVANDHSALGVGRALAEHGRAVPGDVSLVGFDDLPGTAFFSPPLTTVRQDFPGLGQAGLQLLQDQVEAGRRLDRSVLLEPTLVVRESVLDRRAISAGATDRDDSAEVSPLRLRSP